jgi:adhesin HecA-like repeat protein
MKKYLIASVVAMMAFAFAAFAASLNVNGGVLQAGAALAVTAVPRRVWPLPRSAAAA